jgi:magnesium and cobalt transporter
LADRTWRISGDTPIARINEAFDLQLPDDEVDTVGGLIAHEMGHVPKRGERHTLQGFNFVVLHARGGAVKWFKASPATTPEP